MIPVVFLSRHFKIVFVFFVCVLISTTLISQTDTVDVRSLFPQDVICYLEIKDIQNLWKNAKEKALGNMSKEDAKKLEDEMSKVFKNFTEEIKKESGFDVEKLLSEVDSLHFSVNDLSFTTEEEQPVAIKSAFDIELLLALKSVSTGYYDSILTNELKDSFKLISSSPNTKMYELSIKDSDVEAFESIYVVTFDKYAFLSNKKKTIETVEGIYTGKDKTTSLKDNHIYKKILSEVNKRETIELGWIDATKVWNILEKYLDRNSFKIYQQIEAVIEFKALTDLVFYATLDKDNIMTTVKCDVAKNGSELYDLIRQEPASVEVLNVIPEKCLLLVEFRFSDAKQLWTKIKKFITEKEESLADEEKQYTFEVSIEDFESKLGMRIENLLEPFGDEFAFIIGGDSFERAEENMVFIAEISDMDKFSQVEKKFLTESEWNQEQTVTEEEHKGFKITSAKTEGNIFYTTIDKFLFISPTDTFLKEIIDSYLEKKTLKNSEKMKYAMQGLPEKVSKLLYLDGSELIQLTIEGLKGSDPGTKIEELFEKLKFKYVSAFTILEKETEVVVNTSSKIDDIYKSVCVMLGVMYPAFQEAQQRALTYACRSNMSSLAFEIFNMQILKGKFPLDLDEVAVRETPSFKKEQLLQCPASKENFIYLYPVDENRTPPNYILLFEQTPHIEQYNVVYFDQSYSPVTKDDLKEQLKTQLESQKSTLQKLLDSEKNKDRKKKLEKVKAVYEDVEKFIK